MPWERPTLKQLFERISKDFSSRLLDGGQILPRSVISVFAKVWAGASHHMHGVLGWLYRQVFIDTAEAAHMERWAAVWRFYRKESSHAAGQAVWQGLDGATIPAGTLLLYQATGRQYVLQADASFLAGVATLEIKALEPGMAGNLPGGAPLALIAPIAGVQGSGVVSAAGLTGGADEESDESLRSRLLERLRRPPRGGAKHDYVAWALEVPGVTRAWCYPMGLGIGTVSLAFVTDNAPEGPIPSSEMVERVQKYIDAVKPATVREFEAFAPQPLEITIRLAIVPDTQAVRQAVENELNDLIAREGEPGKTILRSHISEAVSLAAGETDHTLVDPVGNIEVPEGFFPMLVGVEFEPAQEA